jgi:hypothetical protein
MRRTFKPPARRADGRRVLGARAGREGRLRETPCPAAAALREQMGQVASRRLCRQKVGTTAVLPHYLAQARAVRFWTTA